jgi:hypothetical protein
MTVTPATHRYVLDRDRYCIAALLDGSHVCRDQWGARQLPTERLTVEHVREDAGGARYDDPEHLVAMCHSGNAHEHWGSANRDLCRAYLAGVRAEAGMHR